MNKNAFITLAIGLALGVGGTFGISALTSEDSKEVTSTQQQTAVTDHNTMSMADMNKKLEGLSGDDYDKAFIEMMIAHHEGAVDMAELSEQRAKHDEIKQLSQEIITAQEKEITDMKQWQLDWGYGSDEASQMMHGNH